MDERVGAPLEGALQIDAACSRPEGLPALALVLSDSLKGFIPGVPQALQVSTIYCSSNIVMTHNACFGRRA